MRKSRASKQTHVAIGQVENIPLDKLILSPGNIRSVGADDPASIAALADSISRRGLLQSIMVRPCLDEAGTPTGVYEVPGGGRRLRALALLVSKNRLASDTLIPCIVKNGGIAEEDSLAENNDREALHPLDQFRAFALLRDKGQGDEQIAAAFGVTPAVVRQRLRLAAASDVLLDAYRTETITLDQLMAFCLTSDHTRQEQVYAASAKAGHDLSPWQIRRQITEAAVRADDPRARFVGIDAYVGAGGSVTRDLFASDDGGWLDDATLLNTLVQRKLDTRRDELLAQGWKWVHAAAELPYGVRRGLRSLQPTGEALTDAERERRDTLADEVDRIAEIDPEDRDLVEVARFAELASELHELDNREPPFDPAEKAVAGVFLTLDAEGFLSADYGYVRPEDDIIQPDGDAQPNPEPSSVDAPAASNEDDSKLSARLIQELTAYKTVGLRHALAEDPQTAVLALLHALCLGVIYHCSSTGPLQIQVTTGFADDAAGLDAWPASKAMQERHRHWKQRLPHRSDQLWHALLAMDDADRSMLQAHCVGMTLNIVEQPLARRRDATAYADQFAATMGFDMAKAGWQPTLDTYLGRVTKTLIAEAVTEAKGQATADMIAGLKRADMAREAERLLDGSGWLPRHLRAPVDAAAAPAVEIRPDLPAFLDEDATAA